MSYISRQKIPAAIFWSVTVISPLLAPVSTTANLPSLNTMDNPVMNSDGTTDIYFGPKSPGEGKNWIATIPGKGWFTLLRLYGLKKAFFDQTRKPDDIKKMK